MSDFNFQAAAKKLLAGPTIALALGAHALPVMAAEADLKATPPSSLDASSVTIIHLDLDEARDGLSTAVKAEGDTEDEIVTKLFMENAVAVENARNELADLVIHNSHSTAPINDDIIKAIHSINGNGFKQIISSFGSETSLLPTTGGKACLVALKSQDYELFNSVDLFKTFGDPKKIKHLMSPQQQSELVKTHEDAHCRDREQWETPQRSSLFVDAAEQSLETLQGEITADQVAARHFKNNPHVIEQLAHYRTLESLATPQVIVDYADAHDGGLPNDAVGKMKGGVNHFSTFELQQLLKHDKSLPYLTPKDVVGSYEKFVDAYLDVAFSTNFKDLINRLADHGFDIKNDLLIKTYLGCAVGLQGFFPDTEFKDPQVRIFAQNYVDSFEYFDKASKAGIDQKLDVLLKKIYDPDNNEPGTPTPHKAAKEASIPTL